MSCECGQISDVKSVARRSYKPDGKCRVEIFAGAADA